MERNIRQGIVSAANNPLQFMANGFTNYMTITPSADVTATVTIPAATDTLANLAGAQTLTNKTLTAPIISNFVEYTSGGAPSNPAAGNGRFYFDSTQKWPYFINDAGKVVPFGIARFSASFATWITFSTGVSYITVNNVQSIVFTRPGTKQVIENGMALPPGWAGRTITFNLWWSPSTTNTGNMQWNIELRRINNGTVLPSVATVTATITSAAPGVVSQVKKDTVTLSLGSFSDGDEVQMAIYRLDTNAGDTFTGNAQFHGVELSVVG